tara:strand:+ start:1446 stop:1703 length:258 start_codon:yes stop_codon:yes gene_type:complete
MIILDCNTCEWEGTPEQAYKYSMFKQGGATLMCKNLCQYEHEDDLEIKDSSNKGTIYRDTHGEGRLLWWQDKTLWNKYMKIKGGM